MLGAVEEEHGAQFRAVPYSEPTERYTALLSGEVDVLYEQLGDVRQYLDSGDFVPGRDAQRGAGRGHARTSRSRPTSTCRRRSCSRSSAGLVVSPTPPTRRWTSLAAACEEGVGTDDMTTFQEQVYADDDSHLGPEEFQSFLEEQESLIAEQLDAYGIGPEREEQEQSPWISTCTGSCPRRRRPHPRRRWTGRAPRRGRRRAAPATVAFRAPDIDYLASVATTADRLGFAGVLTPTGTFCEDAWLTTAALIRETTRLQFLVAFRPGLISPTLAAQMASTFQRISGGRLRRSTSSPAASPPSRRGSATTSPTTSATPAPTSSSP